MPEAAISAGDTKYIPLDEGNLLEGALAFPEVAPFVGITSITHCASDSCTDITPNTIMRSNKDKNFLIII
jgi:hypothetical protein